MNEIEHHPAEHMILVTGRQAASMLNMSPTTLRAMAAKNAVPTVYLPGHSRPRYSVKALQDWIADHVQQPAERTYPRQPGQGSE